MPPTLDLHLISDNYATHKHPKVQRWLARHPRLRMHFTPTSASWLNMVERFFRDLTQNRLRRGVFRDLRVRLNPNQTGPIILADFEGGPMAETRKLIDCRRFPADKPCSIVISGTEDDVLDLAIIHATTRHGHADTPELRDELRSMLQDESSATSEAT